VRAAANGAADEARRARGRGRASRRPANDIRHGSASSVIVRSPSARRRSMFRRVGSDKAAKTPSSTRRLAGRPAGRAARLLLNHVVHNMSAVPNIVNHLVERRSLTPSPRTYTSPP